MDSNITHRPELSSALEHLSQNPHHEFRSVIILLCVITALNNRGHPTYGSLLSTQGPLETPQDSRTLIMNAIASIMVREHEVIAVMGAQQAGSLDIVTAEENNSKATIVEDIDNSDQVDADLSGVTAITNARANSSNPIPASPRNVILVDPVGSCWEDVHRDGWHALSPNFDPALTTHFHTLFCYVKACATLPKKERFTHPFFGRFSQYLVSTSHKKMFMRINNWGSRGFIHKLAMLGRDSVQTAYQELRTRVTEQPTIVEANFFLFNDTDFFSYMNVVMDDKVFNMIMANCPMPSATDALAFREACKMNGATPDSAYTEETCFGFHQLLVATLVAYRSKLRALVNELKGKEKGTKEVARVETQERKDTAYVVWTLSHFLWRLAYSGMLKLHLKALGQRLSIPNDNAAQVAAATEFLNTQDIGHQDEDEDTEDDGELSESLEEPDGGISVTYKRWIRMQVQHFQALKVLTSFSHKVGLTKVSIAFVRPSDDIRIRNLKDTIHDLFSQLNDYDRSLLRSPEHTIQLLLNKLNESKQLPHMRKNRDLLRAFVQYGSADSQDSENVQSLDAKLLGIHCEAALICLRKFHKEANVEMIDDSLDPQFVAVSKLCCPVCWELIKILREQAPMFMVRGHHSTLYPVDLPPWLPEVIVLKLTSKFKQELLNQLKILVNNVMLETPPPYKPSSHPLAPESESSDRSGSTDGYNAVERP